MVVLANALGSQRRSMSRSPRAAHFVPVTRSESLSLPRWTIPVPVSRNGLDPLYDRLASGGVPFQILTVTILREGRCRPDRPAKSGHPNLPRIAQFLQKNRGCIPSEWDPRKYREWQK